MPQYYRINLKDKMGNICYPNIDPNISIDTEGNITIKKKLLVQRNNNENVSHYIEDKSYEIKYTNDEANSSVRFTLINTDTENSDGSNANTSVVTFSGSSNGSVITADYLSLAKYIEFAKDQYYRDGIYVLNLNNSDIIGLNGLYFYDTAESPREGLRWKRTNGNWDSLYAKDGTLYFSPDSTTAAETSTAYSIITSAGGTISDGNLSITKADSKISAFKLESSLTTSSHLAGNKGTAIIYSTAAGTGYNMLARMKSTNGVWTFGSYGTNFNFYYTADSVISAGTNSITKTVTLLNESGNSTFPGTVTASSFSGNASSASKWATARTLTIGSKGKTVDGSGNVSWSLSEIGAAASSHSHGSVGDSTMTIVPQSTNEVNFGGNASGTIYFGYRATGSKAIPTLFAFGGASSAYTDIQAGLIKATKNSNTITIGSQNSSCCHIYNSANIPFYFNRSIQINGDEVLVKNSYTLTHPGRPQLSFSPWTSKLIDLNTCLASSGNDLSYSSNGIKCGRAMKVAVSAQVCLWNFAASETDLLVYKNSTEILQAHTNVVSGMGLVNVCIAPTVISAAAGDVFTMRVVTGASGAFTIIADGKDTHLTLQEV